MNPKPNKKLSLGAGFYVTIAWKGFFTQSQVLLSSIVAGFLALGIPERFCSYLVKEEQTTILVMNLETETNFTKLL